MKKTPRSTGIQREELTPEQQRSGTQKQPDDKAAYSELAQLYLKLDQFQPAEEIRRSPKEVP